MTQGIDLSRYGITTKRILRNLSPAELYEHGFAYDGSSLTSSGANGTDFFASSGLVVVTVFVPPTADFSGQPTAGDAPLQVAFSDLSSGSVNVWSWDFGDGSGSSETDPLHVYALPGTYTVQLTAGSAGGMDSLVQTDLVMAATPAAPVRNLRRDLTASARTLVFLATFVITNDPP